MTHSLTSTLMLLGVIQGLIMATGLWFFVPNRNGLRWLALAILALTLSLLRLWMLTVGLWWHPAIRHNPLAFDLAILPLFYLFALAFTGASPGQHTRARLWLLPWALFMVYALTVYLLGLRLDNLEARDALAAAWRFNDVKAVEDYLTILIGTYLGVQILLRVSRYHRRIARWIPEHQAALIQMLKWMMVTLLVAMGVNIVNFLSNYFIHPAGHTISHVSYVYYAVVIYVMGFLGFRLADMPQFPEETNEADTHPNPEPDTINPVFERLEGLMTDKELFTHPNLNLSDLARRLGLSNQQTSNLIRESAGSNFRTYVNDYRIRYVQQKLTDPDYRRCSILAIALESGFNSEASFYRVFKERVGLSPTAFRETSRKQAGHQLDV